MPSGKLGEQVGKQSYTERSVGKTEQQAGAKPTRAEMERRADYERQKKEYAQQQEEYEQKLSEAKTELQTAFSKVQTPAQAKQLVDAAPTQLKTYAQQKYDEFVSQRNSQFKQEIAKQDEIISSLSGQYLPPKGGDAYKLSIARSTKAQLENLMKYRDDVSFSSAKTYAEQYAEASWSNQYYSMERAETNIKIKDIEADIKSGKITEVSQIPAKYQRYFTTETKTSNVVPYSYISPEGVGYSMTPELGKAKVLKEGGKYYTESEVFARSELPSYFTPSTPVITSPQPNTISEAKSEYFSKPSLPFLGQLGESISRIPAGARSIFLGDYFTDSNEDGLDYILAPFKYTGKPVGEEKIKVNAPPQFGTIVSEEYLPLSQRDFEGTKFEYFKLQGRTSPSLYKLTGERNIGIAKTGIEVGGTLALSTTPTGQALLFPVFLKSGLKGIIEGETTSEKAIGGVSLAASFALAGSSMKGIQKSISLDELNTAIKESPSITIAERTKLGDGVTREVSRVRYSTGGVNVLKTGDVFAKSTKGGGFVFTGERNIFASTTEFMTGKPITFTSKDLIAGVGSTSKLTYGSSLDDLKLFIDTDKLTYYATKGSSSNVYEILKYGKKSKATFDSLYKPSKSLEDFNFLKVDTETKIYFRPTQSKEFYGAGISFADKNTIFTAGGEVDAITFGDGFNIFDVGITERKLSVEIPSAKDSVKFLSSSGKKSSKSFFSNLYSSQTNILSTNLPKVKTNTMKDLITPSSSVVSKNIIGITKQTQPTPAITKTKEKVKSLSIQMPKTSPILISKSLQTNVFNIKLKQPQKNKQLPRLKQPQATKQELLLKQAQMLKQPQKTKQKQVNVTEGFSSSSPYRGTYFRGGGFGIPPFTLPKKVYYDKRTKPTKRTSSVNIPRTPSLVALGERIFSSKPFKGESTGISIRPILRRTKKKKKKKRLNPTFKIKRSIL